MMARVRLSLPDQEATRNFGARLAGLIRPGDVIALAARWARPSLPVP